MSDFQFRLWVNLITYVDDYGRGDARPAVIKGTCFPFRDRLTIKDIEAALKALAGAGCVGLYEVDGKPYLYFPTWESHQRVRQKVSKYPAPPVAMADCDQAQPLAADCGRSRPLAADCGQLRPESRIQNPNPESESRSGYTRTRMRFIPPTIDDVKAYADEKGWKEYQFNAERFVDFYTSKGWKVGKDPMKDWKAAARGWVARQQQPTGLAKDANPALNYSQREYRNEDFADDFFTDVSEYANEGE